MTFTDRTFVCFADDDLPSYELMRGWPETESMAFAFHDALDLEPEIATSEAAAIKDKLRERLATTRQVVVLVGTSTRAASVRPSRLNYELDVVRRLELPVVFANLSGAHGVQQGLLPRSLTNQYTISVAFGPRMIRYALDDFVSEYSRLRQSESTPHGYEEHVYIRRNA